MGTMFQLFLIFLAGQAVASEVIRPRGVSLARKVFYDPNKDFTCIDGTQTIPFSQVNDDYCDCKDGSDEPGTSACSNGKYTCPNIGYVELELHSSKVNDGICDCCDGSDEYSSTAQCVDNCIQLGDAAREAYRQQQEQFRIGHEVREQYKQQAKAKREEVTKQLEELHQQLEQLTDEKQQKSDAKQAAEEHEKKALEQFASEMEAKRKEAEVQQARNQENTAAIEAFRVLDIDQDGIITYTELIVSGRFDQNEDGVVSEDEARFFLAQKDKMDLEEFITLGWILAKPFYQKQKHDEPSADAATAKPTEIPAQEPTDQANPSDSDHQSQVEKEEHEHEVFDSSETNKDEYEELDDEEEYKEDSYKHEDAAIPSEAAEYDEGTKQLLEQAKQAREEYGEVEGRFHDVQNRIREFEGSIQTDYGHADVFMPLHGQCFDYSDREYTYRFCPFDRASQIPKNGGSEISLGRWTGKWTGPEENKYSSLRMESGMTCWNGPPRTTDVVMTCGPDNVIVSATEPSRCEYRFEMQTPALCVLPPNETAGKAPQQHTEL